MTKEEFWNYVEGFGKEPGTFTDDEREEICLRGKNELSPKDKVGFWGELAARLGVNPGNSHKSGESLRSWLKSRLSKKGELPKTITMLNGRVIKGGDVESFAKVVAEQKRELYVAQTLARDAMNEYRDDLRKDGRARSLIDSMAEFADKMAKANPIKIDARPREDDDIPSFREAVLVISDMHLGMQIDSFCNRYNADIAAKRMSKLVSDVIAECIRFKVNTLHVLDLGDAIHGLIHNSSRLSQEYDVAEQVMLAQEMMSQALAKLASAVPHVTYRSCLDNHSRMMANYKDSKDTENFGRLIEFYLRARLKGVDAVTFPGDNIDPSLGMLTLANGETMMFAHGHLDNPTQAIQEISGVLSSMPNGPKRVSYFVLGHYHSEKLKSYQGCRVIVNGSFCGTDEYALSRRLFSAPSQTLLVFNGQNLIEERIGLDIRE